MPAAEKVEKVRELAERLSDVDAAVFADYRGLTVQEAAELRAALAEVDTRFQVVKNRLTRLALKEIGWEGLDEVLVGTPTAIAFIKGDPVAGAKRLVDASKRMPVLEVKGGFAEGRVLSAEDVRALAALESRAAMLARVAGMATGQMSRAAWMFRALQARFLAVLEAYKEKVPAGGPGEEPPEAEPAGSPGARAPETPPEAEASAEDRTEEGEG